MALLPPKKRWLHEFEAAAMAAAHKAEPALPQESLSRTTISSAPAEPSQSFKPSSSKTSCHATSSDGDNHSTGTMRDAALLLDFAERSSRVISSKAKRVAAPDSATRAVRALPVIRKKIAELNEIIKHKGCLLRSTDAEYAAAFAAPSASLADKASLMHRYEWASLSDLLQHGDHQKAALMRGCVRFLHENSDAIFAQPRKLPGRISAELANNLLIDDSRRARKCAPSLSAADRSRLITFTRNLMQKSISRRQRTALDAAIKQGVQ